MGFFTETLRLVVDADTAGAVRGVEKFGGTAAKEFDKSEKSLDRWGSKLTAVGTGMIAFGAAALFGLGKAAQASEEAELSVVKLKNTLGNMPKLAGENSKQFIDLAESIQDVTAADADAIVEGQALLGTFNLTAKEIKGITPLVVDYARKFGMDIPDAAIQVGKALDGQVGALKRNGVSIDEVLFKTDRYMAVQQALSDQVGGFAEQEGKTFAGSIERLKNQMGDLVEGVGSGAVDAFTDLADKGDFLVDKFKEMDPATQSLIGKLTAYGSLALIAGGATSVVAGQTMKLWENVTATAGGVSNLVGKLGGLKNVLIGAGIAAGVAAISVELAKLDDQASKARFEELFGTFDTLVANLGRTGKAAEQQIEMAVALGDKYGGLNDTVRRLADTNVDLAEKFIDAAEAAGIEDEKLDGMRQVLTDHEDAAEQAAAGEGDLGGAMSDTAQATEDARAAIEEYENELNALFDPLFGAQDALLSQQEAMTSVREAQAALTEAVNIYGAGTPEVAAAEAALTAAKIDAQKATVDLAAAGNELRAEVAAHPEKLEQARGSLIQMALAQGFTKDEAFALADQLGLTTDAVLTLDAAPDPVVTIGTIGLEEAIARLGDVQRAMRAIDQAKIHVGVTGYGGGRAGGGPVKADEVYKVGERGEEFFVPKSDGHIYTADQFAGSGSMAAGSWGGGPTEVTIRFERTGDRILDSVIEGLRADIKHRGGGDVQQYLGRRN